ncbi:hypothetical protein BCR39DRAFT_560071 [Naematelia encephala]|uniref:Uncharacterized protein n=1 Tax=Naematelia encephala TaxID=71784 RepID=A0A1Y2AYH0_9TREE|nr:hypothetical protein BCR39DRAFT_560071 [Naematelia encephala]
MSAYSSVSSASSASMIAPYTPYAAPNTPRSGFTESSPIDDLATTPPPRSIRDYSSAITESMRRHLEEMKREDKPMSSTEWAYDHDEDYFNEDPIERHVRLNFPRAEQRRPSLGLRNPSSLLFDAMNIVDPDIDIDMSAPQHSNTTIDVEADMVDDAGPPPFRPGLLHFQRSNGGSSSSIGRQFVPRFTHSETSASRSDSNGIDTPGSLWSEASFEAIRPDDWISMYGRIPEANRTSVASDVTVRPARPALTVRPRQQVRLHPYAQPHSELVDVNHEVDDWLEGRTISETMVAQAGLRCQRGRAARSSGLH